MIVSFVLMLLHRNENSNIGLLLLNEVALGNTYDVKKPEYMEKPPAGYQSCHALSKIIPNPAEETQLK